jgi:WD40 repeat protein
VACARRPTESQVLQGDQAGKEPLFHIPKGTHSAFGKAPAGHTASVTGVDWYSVDNGLFVSGSKDGSVRLWDPNSVATVSTFATAAAVGAVAAAPATGLPPLVAGGCADGSVQLFDVTTGAPTQTLAGVRHNLRCCGAACAVRVCVYTSCLQWTVTVPS